jgi:hypothetical protein
MAGMESNLGVAVNGGDVERAAKRPLSRTVNLVLNPYASALKESLVGEEAIACGHGQYIPDQIGSTVGAEDDIRVVLRADWAIQDTSFAHVVGTRERR